MGKKYDLVDKVFGGSSGKKRDDDEDLIGKLTRETEEKNQYEQWKAAQDQAFNRLELANQRRGATNVFEGQELTEKQQARVAQLENARTRSGRQALWQSAVDNAKRNKNTIGLVDPEIANVYGRMAEDAARIGDMDLLEKAQAGYRSITESARRQWDEETRRRQGTAYQPGQLAPTVTGNPDDAMKTAERAAENLDYYYRMADYASRMGMEPLYNEAVKKIQELSGGLDTDMSRFLQQNQGIDANQNYSENAPGYYYYAEKMRNLSQAFGTPEQEQYYRNELANASKRFEKENPAAFFVAKMPIEEIDKNWTYYRNQFKELDAEYKRLGDRQNELAGMSPEYDDATGETAETEEEIKAIAARREAEIQEIGEEMERIRAARDEAEEKTQIFEAADLSATTYRKQESILRLISDAKADPAFEEKARLGREELDQDRKRHDERNKEKVKEDNFLTSLFGAGTDTSLPLGTMQMSINSMRLGVSMTDFQQMLSELYQLDEDLQQAFYYMYYDEGHGQETSTLKTFLTYALDIQRSRDLAEIQKWGKEHPVLGTLGAAGVNMISGADYLSALAEYTATGETGEHQSNIAVSEIRDTLREGASDNLSTGVGKFLYNVGTSLLDSRIAMATGNTIPMFFLSAASSEYLDAKNRGVSDDQALISATLVGAAECIFEEVSVEKLINNNKAAGKSFARKILEQSFTEASEEGVTALADTITDTLLSKWYGSQTKIQARANELMGTGMSAQDAKDQASEEWALDVLRDAAAGGLSGGLSQLIYSGVHHKSIKSHNQYLEQTGQDITKSKSLDSVRQYAVDNDLEWYGVQSIENAEKAGKLDLRQTGSDAERVTAHIQEQMDGKSLQEQQEIRDKLQEKYGEGILPSVYQAISTVAAQKASTLASTDAIRTARNKAVQSIQDADVRQAVVDGYDQAAYYMAAQANDANELGRYIQQLRNTGEGNMTMEATVKAKDGSERQVAITGMSEDGRHVVLADGVKIAVKDLQTDTDTMDAVQQISRLELGKNADKVFQAYKQSGVTGNEGYRWLMDYTTAFEQGRTNRLSLEEAVKRSSLDEKTVMEAYELGQKDAYADTQKAVDKVKSMPVKEGVTGHKANIDVSRIEGKTMNASEQEQFEFANKVFTAAGVDVVWFAADEKNGRYVGKNGAYENGKVWMDIHAGRNFTRQLASGIMATTGHELTHFLQQYAPEQYLALKQFLFRQIAGTKNGEMTLERLIWEKQKRSENGRLSRKAAEDEVVADACQTMLRDSKAIAEFAKENEEAAKGMARWLDKWFGKLKEMFGHSARLSEEARFVDSLAKDVRKAFGDLWDKGITEAVRTHDRVGSIESGAIRGIEDTGASEQMAEESVVQNSDRLDAETLRFLDNQEHVTVYRAMQMIDGKLYPPMAAKVEGKLVDPTEIGEWYQAVERPDLIDPKTGKWKLDKANGKAIKAAYNPYFHTSATPLNDQFYSAYNRPNIVVVEGIIPKSELTSGYKAQYAKDSVGETKWHAGPVASKLKGEKSRRVFLSRWFQAQRVVSDAEVADVIAKTLEGENISIPNNVVTPSLLEALRERGVAIDERAIDRFESKHGMRQNSDRDTEYLELAKDPEKNKARLQEMVDEAAKNAGYTIKVYHGTTQETISASKGRVPASEYAALEKDYADKLFPFVVFKENGFHTGIYTATDRGVAEDFTFSFSHGGTVYDLYARSEKPLVIDAQKRGWNNLPKSEAARVGLTEDVRQTLDSYKKTRTKGNVYMDDLVEFAKKNKYDAVIVENVRETGNGDETSPLTTDVVVFSSKQLKSADPVTYDDAGNVIPLSQRFNTENQDIRYSERGEMASDGKEHDFKDEGGLTVGVQDGRGHIQFSQRTWRESGRDKMQEYLDERVRKWRENKNDPAGMHPDDAKALMAAVEEQYDAIDEIVKSLPGKYNTYEEWADAEVVTDIFGNPVFSWLKANGDYGLSGDASLICVKRRTLDAVFDYMIQNNMIQDSKDGLKLAQESIVAINDIIRAHGFETACSTCYIDARRYRAAIVAGNFCTLYNRLVKSMIKKDGTPVNAFNFGGNKSVTPLPNSLDTLSDDEINWDGINAALEKQYKTWEKKGWKRGDKELTAGTTEYRIAKALRDKPNLRKLALRSDFLSGNGFLELNKTNKDILTLYNVKKGTGGPKATETDIQYLHEALGESFITPERMFKAGGFRMQSFSDYVPRLVFDYIEIMGDLAAKGVPAHMYTKEILCVLQHGLTGTKINMSLIPAMVKNGLAPGLDADGNYLWRDGQTFGSTAYSLSPKLEAHLSKILGYKVKGRLTGAQGFELAKLIQNDPEYGKNNGTIAIGVSEKQIRKMLDDADIRMVIPYHKSGLNHILASMMEIPGFDNYESYQNTLKWNGSKWVKLAEDFDFNEAVQRHKGDAKAAARDYLAWCKEHGYAPKFSGVAAGGSRASYKSAYDFTKHADWQTGEMTGEAEENYYKVLADFTCYDSSGAISRQEAVQLKYPGTDSAFGSMKALIEMGLESDAMLQAKQDAEVPKIVADIVKLVPKFEQAGRTMEAYEELKQGLDGRQYSERDTAYLEYVESGDMEMAQRYVDYAASRAGYTVKAYHGTYNFGMTKLNPEYAMYFTDSRNVARAFSGGAGVRTIAGSFNPQTSSIEDVIEYLRQTTYMSEGLKPASRRNRLVQEALTGERYNERRRNEIIDAYRNKEKFFVWDDGYSSPQLFTEKELRRKAEEEYREKKNGGTYDTYLNLGKTVTVNGNGAYYTQLPIPGELLQYATDAERKAGKASTDQILRMASEAGYDSVTYKNIVEGGMYGKTAPSTVYAVMNPATQVKSADTVTQDDSGKIIPLSERFDPNNPDIRYSMRDYDNTLSDYDLIMGIDEADVEGADPKAQLRETKTRITGVEKLRKDLREVRRERDSLKAKLDRRMLKTEHEAVIRSKNRELTAAGKREAALREEAAGYAKWAGRGTEAITREKVNAKGWENVADLTARQLEKEMRAKAALAAKLEKQIQREEDILSGKIKTRAIQQMMKDAKEAQYQKDKQHKEEVFQNYRQRKAATEIRNRIKNLHAEMSRDLLRPREGHFVPQSLIRPVVELLDMVNTQTNRAKSEDAQAKIDAINRAYDKLKNDERYSMMYDETVKQMLVELGETVAGRPIYDLSADELSDVYTVMKAMRTTIRNSIKADLIEKGKTAWEAGNQLRQELRNGSGAWRFLGLEKYHMTMLSAKRAFNRFGGYQKDSTWNKTYRMLDEAQLRQITLEMLATRIFDPVLKAKEDLKQAENLTSIKEKDLVDVGLKDENGNAVKITRGMMLSLYMHLQNEENMRHLMYGGMTLPDFSRYYNGKSEAWGRGSVEIPALGARVSNLDQLLDTIGEEGVKEQYKAQEQEIRKLFESVRSAIEEEMTDYDRKWIAASNQFFDGFSRQELNRVTNEMYGFSKAKVDNYYPIVTDPAYLKSEFESISRNISLENAGFMKERVKASNPILLEDITRAVNRQINNVSRYAGLTQALKQFGMVYNTQTKGFTDSIKKAMEKTYGQNGLQYVENLITDMIGGRSQPGTIFDRVKGNYARAVLSANLSVTIKQAASFPTAAATVGWGPIMKALARGGKSNLPISRADRALIDTYSPLLWKRAQGAIDTEIGDMAHARDWTKKAQWLMGWIQKTDLATVGRLWSAAEYYVKDNFKTLEKGTEEQIKNGESPFYRKVAEVFNELVEDTQPNYTVLQRPDILRNPNKLVRAMVMFSTQRFQNANILIDAVSEYAAMVRYDKKSGTADSKAARTAARGKLINAISSQVVSAVVLNAMTLLAGAVLHRMNPWRDDDDELTAASIMEEYLNGFLSSMAGSFLGGSELYEAIHAMLTGSKYYGNDVGGISTIGEFAKAVVQFGQQLVKTVGDEDSTPEDWKNLAENQLAKVGTYLAQMTGIPVANINKIIAGGKNHVIDIVNGEFGSFEAGLTRANATNARRFYKAWQAGDSAKMDKVYQELLNNANGDADKARDAISKVFKTAYEADDMNLEEYTRFITDSGLFDEKQQKNRISTVARNAVTDGSMSEDEAERYLVGSGFYDADKAWETVQRWVARAEYDEENEGGEDADDFSWSKYDAIDAAVDAGQNIDNLVSELTEHGAKADNVKDHIKSHLAERYIGGEINEKAYKNLLSRYCGIVGETADNLVRNANVKKQTGYTWNELDNAYKDGNISAASAKQALTQYGGMTAAEATSRVRYWDFQKQFPDANMKQETVDKYYDTVINNYGKTLQGAGISLSNFVAYYTKASKATGTDANGDGKADSGTKKAEIMQIIDALNLSDAQKDALYYFNGWSAKTINEAPWH